MKLSSQGLYSVVIILLLGVQLCSSTLLAGTMFYYLMGSYFTRSVFPSAIGSLFRGIMDSQKPSQTINHYIVAPNGNGTHSLPVIRMEKEPSTLESVAKLAQAIGLDKRVDNYVKEVWPELKCSLDECKKGKKNKKNAKSKKTSRKDSDEDSDENDLSKPTLTASEEMAGFKIFGQEEDDIYTKADEELADDDPFNFYFIMQDQKRKAEEEKFAALGPSFRHEPPPPREPRHPDFHRRPELSPPHLAFPHPDNPSSSPPFPAPRRGVFPIFIRYKVKPAPSVPVPNNASPMQHSPNKNNFFRRRSGPHLNPQQRFHQPPQANRPFSLFNAANRAAANVLQKRTLLPLNS